MLFTFLLSSERKPQIWRRPLLRSYLKGRTRTRPPLNVVEFFKSGPNLDRSLLNVMNPRLVAAETQQWCGSPLFTLHTLGMGPAARTGPSPGQCRYR